MAFLERPIRIKPSLGVIYLVSPQFSVWDSRCSHWGGWMWICFLIHLHKTWLPSRSSRWFHLSKQSAWYNRITICLLENCLWTSVCLKYISPRWHFPGFHSFESSEIRVCYLYFVPLEVLVFLFTAKNSCDPLKSRVMTTNIKKNTSAWDCSACLFYIF